MNPETRSAVKYSIPLFVRLAAAIATAIVCLVALGLPAPLVAIVFTLAVCVILYTHPPQP